MSDNKTKKEDDKKHSKNISEFIFKFLEDRVGDPLWRSFVFFFIIYNWKAFVSLIFGKFDNPEDRIKLVAKYFTESDFVSAKLELFRSYLIPIIITNTSLLIIITLVFFTIVYFFSGNARKYFAEILIFFVLNIFTFVMLIAFIEFPSIRFITIPFFEAFILIFGYMRYVKPIVVKMYNVNNDLSLESKQFKLNEKENEIVKLKNEIKKLDDHWREYDKANTAYLSYLNKIKDDDYYIIPIDNLNITKQNVGTILQWNGKNCEIIHIFYDKKSFKNMAFLVNKEIILSKNKVDKND